MIRFCTTYLACLDNRDQQKESVLQKIAEIRVVPATNEPGQWITERLK
jgi:hypothetical protein